jgi:hypothetical protein
MGKAFYTSYSDGSCGGSYENDKRKVIKRKKGVRK